MEKMTKKKRSSEFFVDEMEFWG